MLNLLSKTFALVVLLSAALISHSLSAFGNCPGDEYNDSQNHRCLYGTCDANCSKGYKPVLDGRVGICMYCEKGYVHSQTEKTCVQGIPEGSYTKTCDQIKYDAQSDVLQASCKNKIGKSIPASLNDAWECFGYIENNDGLLMCRKTK